MRPETWGPAWIDARQVVRPPAGVTDGAKPCPRAGMVAKMSASCPDERPVCLSGASPGSPSSPPALPGHGGLHFGGERLGSNPRTGVVRCDVARTGGEPLHIFFSELAIFARVRLQCSRVPVPLWVGVIRACHALSQYVVRRKECAA